MHPVWVQKIEEARRKSVLLFWGSMFFVVVLPILIMFRADFFMLLGMFCFGAAGVRLYLAGARPPAVSRAGVNGNPALGQTMPIPNQAVTMQPGMQAQTMQMHMSGQAMRTQTFPGVFVPGQMVAQPQQPASAPVAGAADGFFQVSLDPGQPLIPQGVVPQGADPAPTPAAEPTPPEAPAEVVEEQPVFRSMHFHDIALGKRTPPAQGAMDQPL